MDPTGTGEVPGTPAPGEGAAPTAAAAEADPAQQEALEFARGLFQRRLPNGQMLDQEQLARAVGTWEALNDPTGTGLKQFLEGVAQAAPELFGPVARQAYSRDLAGNAEEFRRAKRLLLETERQRGATLGIPQREPDPGYAPPPDGAGDDQPPAWAQKLVDDNASLREELRAIRGTAGEAANLTQQTRNELMLASELRRVAESDPVASSNFERWSSGVQGLLRSGRYSGPGAVERASKALKAEWRAAAQALGYREPDPTPGPPSSDAGGITFSPGGEKAAREQADTLVHGGWRNGKDFSAVAQMLAGKLASRVASRG